MIQDALDVYRKEQIPEEVPESLPLLEEFIEEKPAGEPLADVEILLIQHHLGPLVPRVKAMMRDGLDPKRCWFIDIPYSTNDIVWEELRSMGCPREQSAEPFNDPLKPYSNSQLQRVQGLILDLAGELEGKERRCRLLVVDDGAYFVRAIGNLANGVKERIIGILKNRTYLVEQTTRGYRYLKEKKNMEIVFALGSPVVSVARSYTKSYLESPFIGASVSRGVVQGLSRARRMELGEVLVIGFGNVGEATTHSLMEDVDVGRIDVFDTNPEKAGPIKDAGANPLSSLPESGSYDFVMGCTGYASFPLEKRSLLADEALLASGSSAAIELNREKFVELADKLPDDEIEILNREATKEAGIHATIELRDAEQSFSFLSAGFPINFDGSIECLPARLIQPTHALLFAASRQSLQTKSPGISFLNFEEDFWIYKHGLERLGKDSG
ncbi:MAG: hypothetical protein ACE5KV_01355 [Thermoplasmata archaeon]